METPRQNGTMRRLALLADPVRRALYFFVAQAAPPGEVSRDQAARGVGIARPLAAFHLDKLADEGLLEISYRHLTKRRGPGAGRPAKLYRRSAIQVDFSLPPREYELAARLFARAITQPAPGSTTARARVVARAFGKDVGTAARRGAGGNPTRRSLLRQLQRVLRDHGYEPLRASGGTIRLRNCPFDALAREHRPLTCGMNQALLAGVVQGLSLAGCKAVADPQPGMCCVRLDLAVR